MMKPVALGILLVLPCTAADPLPADETAARFIAAEDFSATVTAGREFVTLRHAFIPAGFTQ